MALTAEQLAKEINDYLADTDNNDGLWLDVDGYGGDIPDQIMSATLDGHAIVFRPWRRA